MISVIVPVYNAAATLVRCVGSILAQTLTDYELILVDDGSTDSSPALCDSYAGGQDRIRVIHKENGGLMSAWMAGVGIAQGQYLCFLDSDDWVEPQYLAHLAAGLDPSEPGFRQVICGSGLIDHAQPDGSVRSEPMIHGAAPGSYRGERLRTGLLPQLLGNENRTVLMSRCMKLIEASLILDSLEFCDPRIRMGEDVNIILPVLLQADEIVILPDACDYHYIYMDASMVHAYDAGMEENTARLFARLRQALAAHTDVLPPETAEAMLGRERSFFYLLEFKNELRSPAGGLYTRVRGWMDRNGVSETIRRYPMAVRERNNRLLMTAMYHPWRPLIWLLGLLFRWKHKVQ